MGDDRLVLPQGTLDLLILKALALEPLHGWAVSERLQQISRDALQVGQGSLYPSLHRLERGGLIKADWRTTGNNRRAKYYELTRAGPEAAAVGQRVLAQAVGGGRTRPRSGLEATGMLTDLLFRVRALVRRGAVEAELDEELRDHLEHETRKYVEAGLSPSDAARRARLAMGGLDGVKEQCRDARGTRPLEDFVTDLRYGLRLLARSPGFAAAAIAMLGLGVGSATAIFGIVEGVLLRPLPYPNSERIVTLAHVDADGRRQRVSLPDFRDWAAQAKSVDAIAALRGDSTTAVVRGQGHRIDALRFHGDVLRVFGSATAARPPDHR